MNSPNDPYADWLREKREQSAPSAFADEVMQAIAPASTHVSIPIPSRRLQLITFWAKAAMLVLAAVVGVGRYAVLLFCLLFS